MDKQEILSWAITRCNELVNSYLVVNHRDWDVIDKATLTNSWNETEEIFTFILCMRKTGSDLIILERSRQIDALIADINNYLLKSHNEKFYIINPLFREISEVSSLKALSWSMYLFKDKYSSLKFESDNSISIKY